MIQRSCACGNALKIACFADDPTAHKMISLWEELHSDHKWCSAFTAREIRETGRRSRGVLVDE